MFCTKCGKENPNNSRFCHSCGTPLGDAPVGGAPQPQAPRSVYAAKKKNKLPMILLIAGLAVLLLAGMFIGKNLFFGSPVKKISTDQFENLAEKYDLEFYTMNESILGEDCEIWAALDEYWGSQILYAQFPKDMDAGKRIDEILDFFDFVDVEELEDAGVKIKQKQGKGYYYLRGEDDDKLALCACDKNGCLLAMVDCDSSGSDDVLKMLDKLGY